MKGKKPCGLEESPGNPLDVSIPSNDAFIEQRPALLRNF